MIPYGFIVMPEFTPPMNMNSDGHVDTQYAHQFISDVFRHILDNSDHDSTITHAIVLGLIVKMKKLYDSSYRLMRSDEGIAYNIVSRSCYEVSITLRYIVQYLDDDETIKKFLIGNAMSKIHKLNYQLRTTKINKENYTFEINMLRQSLGENSIDIKEIPRGIPKSWHPTKSYRDIARALDDTGEALGIYDAFYAGNSLLSHPSLDDIMRWHVTKKDNDSPFVPNEHPMYGSEQAIVILQCLCLAALTELSLSATEHQDIAFSISDVHLKLHQFYNDDRDPMIKYIESLKRYADFWSQNYDDISFTPT